MKLATYEEIVDDGQIKLVEAANLPEQAKVDAVIEVDIPTRVRMMSPRLAHREQAADFTMEVTEESPDAGL